MRTKRALSLRRTLQPEVIERRAPLAAGVASDRASRSPGGRRTPDAPLAGEIELFLQHATTIAGSERQEVFDGGGEPAGHLH
ncbi:MAG: hypothetical protein AVDCRST_MAG50-1307 [uncultured Acidimicrobiales bacterium]|uniref:Uncharacterized protein n=1 Tax=uncultured Acidimicrobiales bacterium TaxID=310071 RepID=A0A6J4HW06_9ACTN|nr:MAG: hypothetical protein AVDCRST_MAG50-1307 [uncultured Acidimicrobiales bacterium]